MTTCDVLVVGGGPAGSSCAWALRQAGADVVVIDRARFPRDKLCAGWITPEVLRNLRLTPDEYRDCGLVIQQITGFRTSVLGVRGKAIDTRYARIVSFAIRRCEFDTYLLRRSGARLLEGTPLRTLTRTGRDWIANDALAARLVVGAGGHFCPVAKHLNTKPCRGIVVAREAELPLSDSCDVDGETPELFFSHDLDGYGWCVRKQNHLNVGIGRRQIAGFDAHVRGFAELLAKSGRIPAAAANCRAWRGHAYLLRGFRSRIADEGVLLAGDAAGLAYAESGEGIGPAVRSGLVAAHTIVAARGEPASPALESYAERLGIAGPLRHTRFSKLRVRAPAAIGRAALRSPLLTREALDRWFLRTKEGENPPIPEEMQTTASWYPTNAVKSASESVS
jgi:flavin-dependent dehydrogenase